MSYVLRCACGTKILVHRSQAGSRIACPQCEQPVEIPTIRGLSELEIEEEPVATVKSRSVSRHRWTPLKGTIAAACFVIALIGLGRSGLYGYYRWSNPTPLSEVEMLREAEQLVNEFTPAETWDTWRYLQESGLGTKQPPQALVAKRFLEKQDLSMRIWAAAGIIGLLGLIACTYCPSRNLES